MVGTHEQHVHHDTEGDEELREGIEHNNRKNLNIIDKIITTYDYFTVYLCSSYPQPTAIPNTHDIRSSFDAVKYNIFHFRSLVIIILNDTIKKSSLKNV